MGAYRKNDKKKEFLEAYRKTLGIITTASRAVGCDRRSVWRWRQQDKAFDEACKEIEDEQIEFVENKLLKRIDDNDTTAMIFYLKTKGKSHGYIERQEITGRDGDALCKGFVVEVIDKRDKVRHDEDDTDDTDIQRD